MKPRIGAVSYLNTKPLIYGLQQRLPSSQIVLDLPSRLADRLMAGELEVALIPSIEYFRRSEDLAIASDACIACCGAVRSVQLLFRCHPSEVRTLALDEGSRTSAVLAQVLLHRHVGVRPQLQPLPIDADFQQSSADAVLVIGDRAMSIDATQFVQCWDLGQQWYQTTGLPFVFAMWVVGQQAPTDWDVTDTIRALCEARDAGLAHVAEIAAQQAPIYDLTIDDCLNYFTNQLHFTLRHAERSGLALFEKLADSLGLIGRPATDASTPDHAVPASTHRRPTQRV
ncbi:MAG: menaquinone biosynthesis protein [Pirellulaceae bacterium]|nr:menaquinone biosynthesis protein [Pirellulaceae bacterium]